MARLEPVAQPVVGKGIGGGECDHASIAHVTQRDDRTLANASDDLGICRCLQRVERAHLELADLRLR